MYCGIQRRNKSRACAICTRSCAILARCCAVSTQRARKKRPRCALLHLSECALALWGVVVMAPTLGNSAVWGEKQDKNTENKIFLMFSPEPQFSNIVVSGALDAPKRSLRKSCWCMSVFLGNPRVLAYVHSGALPSRWLSHTMCSGSPRRGLREPQGSLECTLINVAPEGSDY